MIGEGRKKMGYFKDIEGQVQAAYSIATEARAKHLDPVSKVEVPLTRGLPERVVGLVSSAAPQIRDVGIEKRMRDLEKEHGFLDPAVALVIGEEVANEKFCKFQSKLEAVEVGMRVGFAYLTLGSVASPLERIILLFFILGRLEVREELLLR